MRPAPLLLLALALAGCTTPEGDPSPQAGAPLDIHLSHDYAKAEETLTFDLAEPVAKGKIRLAFDGVVAGTTLRIVVLDPAGAEAARLEMPGTTVSPGATEMKSTDVETAMAAGAWTATFTGTAAQGTGRVDVTS